MAKIQFQFEDNSIPAKTVEGSFVDQSILEITEDYDVHLNHNCGGVCACSTCHIYVESGEDFLEEISDKEEDFLVSVYDLARIPFRKAFYYKRAPQTSLANHPTDALFPQSAKLGWGYPNPFNSNIQIPYSVYSSTTISLAIYDIHGRLIQRLINNDQHMPGDYEVTWDGYNKERKEVSSGIYFLVLRYGGFQTSQKIFLIR